MEDIYSACREGNIRYVKLWLEETTNDLNQGDDHGFTPLHWASREGWVALFDILVARGARINNLNNGGDTPLHCAVSKGQKPIVLKLLNLNAHVNIANEHGNTPLHYACFWSYEEICRELIKKGANVSQCNKLEETPIDRAKVKYQNIFKAIAKECGQDLKRIPYKPSKHFHRSRDLRDIQSRNSWIEADEVTFKDKLETKGSSDLWKGIWSNLPVVCKKIHVSKYNRRKSRDFAEEYPKLRIFSHPNVLPVLGAVNESGSLVILSQYMPYGSLYNVLHEGSGVMVDAAQALKFAMDIAKGMQYLHSLDPFVPKLYIKSSHIMIDDDLTARIAMADYRYSFQDVKCIYQPQWMAPEVLNKNPEQVDQRSADMWSFAILLWEMTTREVPFVDMPPMEVGMKIALEGLRPSMPPGFSPHVAKLINICWNSDPTKRPRFDQVIPIMSKMVF
ncbi:integrin-linked protein kinase-like [Xenia sp. Carnegie-2017]|uniref:integrin-linked protein kinase-like n=1 Tax=Xenia sp. Carnegie-2017 TaxID=2897299 RepID=UPI001F0428E7|nr:integrin-linked protein kinase-like [Xenia sp. Carnegie-2017]